MAKLIHDRNQCIHCGACVSVCPEFFSETDKIVLNGANYDEDDRGILEIPEDKISTAQTAVDSCPVGCIHIEK